MGSQSEKIINTYHAHCELVSIEKRLFLELPNFPNRQLRPEDKLTLPHLEPDSPGAVECPNSEEREDMWLACPHARKKHHTFLTLLGHVCVEAKLRDCRHKQCLEMKEAMEKTAPACGWKAFRDWAILAMSCQQAFSFQEKLSVAHTHLVNIVFTCYERVGYLRDEKKPFRKSFKGPPQVDLADVCNVIFWMATIQQSTGLVPEMFSGWDHHFLPEPLTLPGIHRALVELQSMKICRNRLWNMVNLAERKQSDLPDILDFLKSHPFIQHEGHDLCTQTKCQSAHRDSTTVGQLHKCPRKDCSQSIFPVHLVETALQQGGETAWSRHATRMILPGESYIAISHVWSDGTGVGAKNHGSVNTCLFNYFIRIAEDLKCDAIWWDALSIPLEAKARSIALSKMHTNYANATYTVVHDQSLIDLEWTDRETACLALVMSPWFTRGWTALELAMSPHVKVLFKGSGPKTPDVRDLDTDILASGPGSTTRAHWLATCVIRRLRASIHNLSDLLAILRPRSTSWVRDRTIIAALLANIPSPNFTRSESQITQDLILHLGSVPHVNLLHGRPTMAESGGFSWCPTVLDDMPIDIRREFGADEKDRTLTVVDDGAVIGYWCARPISKADVERRRIRSHGSDIEVVVKVDSALLDWKNCLILYQGLHSDGPGLLVTTIEVCPEEGDDPIIDCRYVGAVRDSRTERKGIINISKFEGDPDFRKFHDDGDSLEENNSDEDNNSDDDDDNNDDDDSDDSDDDDYNNFSMFTIRLGNDGGKNGVRAWDILRTAWKLSHDKSEAEPDSEEEQSETEDVVDYSKRKVVPRVRPPIGS